VREECSIRAQGLRARSRVFGYCPSTVIGNINKGKSNKKRQKYFWRLATIKAVSIFESTGRRLCFRRKMSFEGVNCFPMCRDPSTTDQCGRVVHMSAVSAGYITMDVRYLTRRIILPVTSCRFHGDAGLPWCVQGLAGVDTRASRGRSCAHNKRRGTSFRFRN